MKLVWMAAPINVLAFYTIAGVALNTLKWHKPEMVKTLNSLLILKFMPFNGPSETIIYIRVCKLNKGSRHLFWGQYKPYMGYVIPRSLISTCFQDMAQV